MYVAYVPSSDLRLIEVGSLNSTCIACGNFLRTSYCRRDCYGLFRIQYCIIYNNNNNNNNNNDNDNFMLGEVGGQAQLDSCNICSGGNTGLEPEKSRDCAGYCSGPFSLSSEQCSCKRISACLLWPSFRFVPPDFSELQYIWKQTSFQRQSLSFSTSINFSEANLSAAIALPFSFKFFNESVTQVYVSSAGGFFLDDDSPACFRGLFMPSNLTRAQCRLRSIAGFLSVDNLFSSVFLDISPTQLCVSFNRTFYLANLIICLRDLGTITFIYGQFSSLMDNLLLSTSAVVGLRNGWLPLGTSYFNTAITDYLPNSTQSRQYWIAIPSNRVASYQTFEFCQISKDACISPSVVNPNGGAIVRNMSCLSNSSSLTCKFGFIVVNATIHTESGAIRCFAPPGINDTIVLVDLLLNGSVVTFRTQLTLQYLFTASVPTLNDTCHTCHGYMSTCGALDCSNTWSGNASLDGTTRYHLQNYKP
jgi:hypothetical protein